MFGDGARAVPIGPISPGIAFSAFMKTGQAPLDAPSPSGPSAEVPPAQAEQERRTVLSHHRQENLIYGSGRRLFFED
jgi:hypothetical protein